MKKIILTGLLIIFSVLFLSSSVLAAESDFKTVRVGIYDNNPKIYKDADGNIKGFWADITNYIAKQENWNLIYVYGTWDEGLARLEKGEIDLMVDVAVSDARKEKYDFNKETALLSWSIIYTRKDFDIKSFKDLEGKNIAIMKSSVHYTAPLGLKNVLTSFMVNANIIDAKSMDDVFKLLDNNEADAGVVNWNFGVTNENKYKITRTGIIFNPSELNYALTKNSSKNNYLINVIDFRLRELKNKENSIYYQSINTNFSKSLGTVEIQVWPKWLKMFLIIVGSLLVVAIAGFLLMEQYQKTLKKEINKRIHEIKESEKKYSAVVNQAQDGIVIIQDQIIKYANKAINIIGYTDVEVLGKPFINLIAPEEQKKISENYIKRLAGQEVGTIYETKLAHKNGSIMEVEFSSGVIEYGDKPAVLVMVRDITERKKMEIRFKELDGLKTKFIKIVSHQLRTPLNVSRWNLELLLSGSHGQLKEDVKEILHSSLDANIEVINRIGDLLTALDIEENRLAYLKKTSISIEDVWKSVLQNFKSKYEIKNINYSYQPPEKPLPKIEADADKIKTSFEKIIDNAINYTKENGKITASFEKTDNKILFKITDTGIGIPQNDQKEIGARFFRASNASVAKTDASGLGLFIAKYFIQQHNGKFGFESKENEGSTFWFELPVTTTPEIK